MYFMLRDYSAYKLTYMHIARYLDFKFLNQLFKMQLLKFPYLRNYPFYCARQYNYFQMNFSYGNLIIHILMNVLEIKSFP